MPQNEPKQPWEARVTEAGARVQDELRRIVDYIDSEVVPEVRRNGSSALRSAADRLQQLAQHLEQARSDDTRKDDTRTDEARTPDPTSSHDDPDAR